MSDDAKWLTDLHMAQERIQTRAYALDDLVTAFRRVGNEPIARELALHVLVLNEVAKSISQSTGEICSLLMKQAGESSTNMVNAALAGVEIAQRHSQRCPTCDSPKRSLHPSLGAEGEVQPCSDSWHAVHSQ